MATNKSTPESESEYTERRQIVGADLAGRKLDAFLVSFSANLRYLSGFTGSNGSLLVLPDRAIFFTDPRYEIQAGLEVSCTVKVCKGPLVEDIAKTIDRYRLGRIGYEPARMTCDWLDSLRSKLPAHASLEPVTEWIEQLRMVKSPVELERIRTSVETNSRAFEQAVKNIGPRTTEKDLAAELEYRMRRLGAEKPAFETIVASGERGALPHAQPTGAPLTPNSLVVVDMGAVQDGYSSDMTRMLFLGSPSRKVRSTYRAVLEAQEAAIQAVRSGVSTAHIDRQARKVLDSHGLGRAFVHSTGHGLGLEIHEPPRIGKKDKGRLETGMAITIEPGVYLEGFGGIRIEDTVVVTANGCEILTPTSKDLRVI